ncbi:MAG TPA: [Fe-Fe] hydrogenase large subunit C-terminal domain-containing protein, partial [Spirochaetia bacterium]|nr:[Fe-Fe] hydrogenase large subunit C-terminal domain-containing protein [Spirochaetia bacterium]
VLCGHCVKVCPAGAKVIRDDKDVVRDLLATGARPWLSLAPSWPAEFPDWTPGRWVAAARALGFAGVSETALGAQAVIGALAPVLTGRPGLHLSTACPTVVGSILKYHPGLSDLLTPVPSPLNAHARGLKALYGTETPVVFVGPCAAKKHEADREPGLIAAALTFQEWEQLVADHGRIPPESGDFEPWPAGPGAAFALDGGMKQAFDRQAPGAGWHCLSISGFDAVQRTLAEAAEAHRRFSGDGQSVFLELLSCEGGCTHGPGTSRSPLEPLSGRLRVEARLNTRLPSFPSGPLTAVWTPDPVVRDPVDEETMGAILHRLGKATPRDQLNCSGCGYETCRQFAEAVGRGRAETDMCVSFNRKWAQKKLSALVRTMPFALVIADDGLRILEANGPFGALAGGEAQTLADCVPGLEGLALGDFVPFANRFREVLDTGSPRIDRNLAWAGRQLDGWLFPIDDGRAVGGLFQDVTEVRERQGRVVDQTRAVLRKNVEIVQKIAFLLGENAADTEAILNSILLTFGDEP